MNGGDCSRRKQKDWVDVGEIHEESGTALPERKVQNIVTGVFQAEKVSSVVSDA